MAYVSIYLLFIVSLARGNVGRTGIPVAKDYRERVTKRGKGKIRVGFSECSSWGTILFLLERLSGRFRDRDCGKKKSLCSSEIL